MKILDLVINFFIIGKRIHVKQKNALHRSYGRNMPIKLKKSKRPEWPQWYIQ